MKIVIGLFDDYSRHPTSPLPTFGKSQPFFPKPEERAAYDWATARQNEELTARKVSLVALSLGPQG